MKIFSWGKKTQTNRTITEEEIESWSDEDCLKNFMKFMNRVGLSTSFVENDVGFIVAETLHAHCGDYCISSPELQLDWPLEPVVFPEIEPDARRRLN